MILDNATATGTGNTKRYQQKYEALIAAAATRFNQAGFSGTTITDIASDVGLVKNSVTYYFKRKEDLALACFMRTLDVYEALIAQAAGEPSVARRVAGLLRSFVELEASIARGEHPDVISFLDGRGLPEPHREKVFERYTNMFLQARSLLQGRETAGWPRAALNARAHLLVAQIHGIKALCRNYYPEDHALLAERMADILLYGIHSESSAWPVGQPEMEWLAAVSVTDMDVRFLRAATQVINDYGYAGASVNRIAEKLSLTKGAFYHHNEKKDDLGAQCFEYTIATIRKAMNLAQPGSGSGWSHLCSFVNGLIRFQVSEEGPLLRATSSTILSEPTYRRQVGQELTRINQRISGVVVGGMVDTSIRPVDPSLTAYVLRLGVAAAEELPRWVRQVTEESAPVLFGQPLLMGLLCPAHMD